MPKGVFAIVHLIIRIATHLTLREVQALCVASKRCSEACSTDEVWQAIFRAQWGEDKKLQGNGAESDVGWKQRFKVRLRRAHAHFAAKALPAHIKKLRRRDGLPDMQKLHDCLKLKYSLRLAPTGASEADVKVMPMSADSISIFASSVLLRCSFSSMKFRLPLRLEVVARSGAMGSEQTLLSTTTCTSLTLESWGERIGSDDNFNFIRSPCGRVLLVFWKSDRTLAGLFVSLHHASVLRPFLSTASSSALQALVGKPPPDDVDSKLGLHGYTVLLALHSARLDLFSNCFYNVAAIKDGTFDQATMQRHVVLERSSEAPPEADEEEGSREQGRAHPSHKVAHQGAAGIGARAAKAPTPARERGGAASLPAGASYKASVANFEVVAPHKSGTNIPFPCLRQPQLAFQTTAFRSLLADTAFVDITVFDEHNHIFWGASAVVRLTSGDTPHESAVGAQRFVEVDFDRDGTEKGAPVRWLCLAEQGVAQLVVQLEYSAPSPSGEEPLPRLNSITWHPELSFLNSWWGSQYAQGQK